MEEQKKIPQEKPPISCWFCGHILCMDRVLLEGIVLARDANLREARRLLICPECLTENLCEETRKGRWFASPNVTLGLIDILFSRFPGAATEEVLQAISWYRENEDHRRLFFLRDGDRRYEKNRFSYLRKLWPWGDARAQRPAGADSGRRREGPGKGRYRHAAGAGERGSSGSGGEGSGKAAPSRSPLVTPYEVLGLEPNASVEEIREAFHRLAVQYHPDKVHHMGEDFREMAHFRFKELMRAYETLLGRQERRKRHG